MRNVRVRGYSLIALVLVSMAVSLYSAVTASAAQITNRSLTLMTSTDGNTGGSTPGGNVNHKFTFTLPTTQTLGSIKFEYCTIAVQDACVTPTGMDAAAATFGNETGSTITGFSLASAATNSVVIRRTANSTSGNVTVQINNVKNPTTPNYTFFVRITSHATINGTGAIGDSGSVAASTATQIVLSGIMPESLVFCTGSTIGLNATTLLPDCSTAGTGLVSFTSLFSTTATSFATSQMAASTNAGQGYTITVNGKTLMNGTTPIPNITVAKGPSIGVSEFGMNLVQNQVATTPVGGNITPISNPGGNKEFRAQALAGYNTTDIYKFVSGDAVANSGNDVLGPTNAQRYTATYMVNVAGNQLAGTYATTITYVCTPTF